MEISYNHLFLDLSITVVLVTNAPNGVGCCLWISFEHVTNVIFSDTRLCSNDVDFVVALAIVSSSQFPMHDVGRPWWFNTL